MCHYKDGIKAAKQHKNSTKYHFRSINGIKDIKRACQHLATLNSKMMYTSKKQEYCQECKIKQKQYNNNMRHYTSTKQNNADSKLREGVGDCCQEDKTVSDCLFQTSCIQLYKKNQILTFKVI